MRPNAFLALCLLACGSSESPPPSGSGAGTSSGDTSSGGTSSGGTSGGGTSGSSGEVPGPVTFTPTGKTKQGAVNVFVRPEAPGEPPKLTVAGFFLDYTGADGHVPDGYSRGTSRATECTKRIVGDCEAVKCKLTPDPAFRFATPKYVSAGKMTVTRSSGGAAIEVTPDSGNTYLAKASDPPAVSAGETVSIAVAGADVAAFSETVPFVRVVVPNNQETVVTKSDVIVSWTGGAGAGKLLVSGETGSEKDGFVAALACRFDIAANKGTIPVDVLADVRGNRFGMVVSPEPTTKQIGDFEVSFRAETSDDIPPNSFALVVSQ